MSGLVNKVVSDGSVQLIGAVPGNTYASVNIGICNLKETDLEGVRIWISAAANPSDVDVVEPNATIPGYGTYDRTGRLCTSGENVFVRCPAGGVIRLESVEEI